MGSSFCERFPFFCFPLFFPWTIWHLKKQESRKRNFFWSPTKMNFVSSGQDKLDDWISTVLNCNTLSEVEVRMICEKAFVTLDRFNFVGERGFYQRKQYPDSKLSRDHLWWYSRPVLWLIGTVQHWRLYSRRELLVYGRLCGSWRTFCFALLMFVIFRSKRLHYYCYSKFDIQTGFAC